MNARWFTPALYTKKLTLLYTLHPLWCKDIFAVLNCLDWVKKWNKIIVWKVYSPNCSASKHFTWQCCYFHKNTKLALKMLNVSNHHLLLCCQCGCFFLLTYSLAFFFQVCVLDFDSFCASASCSKGRHSASIVGTFGERSSVSTEGNTFKRFGSANTACHNCAFDLVVAVPAK